jgi:hypothetical protein
MEAAIPGRSSSSGSLEAAGQEKPGCRGITRQASSLQQASEPAATSGQQQRASGSMQGVPLPCSPGILSEDDQQGHEP